MTKKLLIENKEKRKQLLADLSNLKEKNNCLSGEICNLKQTVHDLNSVLEGKAGEIETLKYTVQLWERRREAAKKSGHVTVEDVLVEKMK